LVTAFEIAKKRSAIEISLYAKSGMGRAHNWGGEGNPKMNKVAQDFLADFESLLIGRRPYASQQSGALFIRMCDFSRSNNPKPSYWMKD